VHQQTGDQKQEENPRTKRASRLKQENWWQENAHEAHFESYERKKLDLFSLLNKEDAEAEPKPKPKKKLTEQEQRK